eukprot:jgi/Mesen1/5315/ME000265S04478
MSAACQGKFGALCEFVQGGERASWSCAPTLASTPLSATTAHLAFGRRTGSRTSSGLCVRCNTAASGRSEAPSSPPFAIPTVKPNLSSAGTCCSVIVREVMLEDYWEVADVHCTSFFPNTIWPMSCILRADRVISLLGYLSMPTGLQKKCLVAYDSRSSGSRRAVTTAAGAAYDLGSLREMLQIGLPGLPLPSILKSTGESGYDVAGSVTVDTAAEFLKRKGIARQRRKGIAYLSNMAVQRGHRRQGVARKLLFEAEALGRSWACRSMALHCDISNDAAVALYKREGYRLIPPYLASMWPEPYTDDGVELRLMMKYLGNNP